MAASGGEDENVNDPNQSTDVSQLDDGDKGGFRKFVGGRIGGLPRSLGVMGLKEVSTMLRLMVFDRIDSTVTHGFGISVVTKN